jgi:hypothetical protein
MGKLCVKRNLFDWISRFLRLCFNHNAPSTLCMEAIDNAGHNIRMVAHI